jgi:xanthine phosphoribosyltransferase
MSNQNILALSWDAFHRDTRTLATRLAAIGGFSAIAAVTRGGMFPAGVIARELGIRVIDTVCVASYHEETERGEIAVLKSLSQEILARPTSEVLIIDDLVDTGATARIVRELLPHAHFATVYAKPKGRYVRAAGGPGNVDLLSLGHGFEFPGAYRQVEKIGFSAGHLATAFSKLSVSKVASQTRYENSPLFTIL